MYHTLNLSKKKIFSTFDIPNRISRKRFKIEFFLISYSYSALKTLFKKNLKKIFLGPPIDCGRISKFVLMNN